MIFEHWTYNQFWLARLSLDVQPTHFSNDEIEWALKQIIPNLKRQRKVFIGIKQNM